MLRIHRVARAAGRGCRVSAASRLPHFVRGPDPAVAARRLAGLRVAVAGCGSVGLGLVERLARMGMAELLAVDPGHFKAESLLTHPVITPAAIGHSKAAFAARHAARVNTRLRSLFAVALMQDLPLAQLRDYDLLVVATDNLESESALGTLARRLGIPLVHAAVEGQTLTAQISVFANLRDSGPCPACLFGPLEWDRLGENTRFSCAGGGGPARPAEPTMSVPHLCGLAADLGTQQILRLVLSIGPPVGDTLLTFCGYSNQVSVARMTRSESCPCDHRAFKRVSFRRRLASAPVPAILAAAGIKPDRGCGLELPGYLFVPCLQCRCAAVPAFRGFVTPSAESVRCRACGRALPLSSFHCNRVAAARLFRGTGWRAPLDRLGARHARCALVTSESTNAIVFEENGNS